MILLDTHVWFWWVNADSRLPAPIRQQLELAEPEGLAISAISCWEIAYKAALGRLDLGGPVREWLNRALQAPNVRVEAINEAIAVEAALLPDQFHKDPADRLIVATARVLDVPLLSLDSKITAYPHVTHA